MQELIARADMVARLLKHRGETIAVAESSTGGLIAAALLALPARPPISWEAPSSIPRSRGVRC